MADNNIINEPDPSLLCFICSKLTSQPKQCEDCGKLFCSECIQKNGINNPCPSCKKQNPKYFKDAKSAKEIQDIAVQCSQKDNGCSWTGTIGILDTHLAKCDFIEIPCPNKCEDEESRMILIMKKDLENHLQAECAKRLYECQHCGKNEIYSSITGKHNEKCGKKIVACPNKESGCKLSIERIKIKEHVGVCEFTEVACSYETLGCEVRKFRKDILKHETEDETLHAHLGLEVTKSREEEQITLSEGKALIFKISEYNSKKDNKVKYFSPPFYTHAGGYKMCLRVSAYGVNAGAGTHLSVGTKLLEGRYDDKLSWPFEGNVTYELLNQLADDRHYKKTLTVVDTHTMRFGYSNDCVKFLPHSSLCLDEAENTQYLMGDTLFLKVSVTVKGYKAWLTNTIISKPLVIVDKTLTSEERFVFQIPEISKWQDNDKTFSSSPFYTSPGGYKMCIRVYVNGCSTGRYSHVSVYAKLMEGSYDHNLSWPFLGTITVTLLNQLADENHHTKVIKFDTTKETNVGEALGDSHFIAKGELSHDPLRTKLNLKHDTLYFRVFVNSKNSTKQWLACT